MKKIANFSAVTCCIVLTPSIKEGPTLGSLLIQTEESNNTMVASKKVVRGKPVKGGHGTAVQSTVIQRYKSLDSSKQAVKNPLLCSCFNELFEAECLIIKPIFIFRFDF